MNVLLITGSRETDVAASDIICSALSEAAPDVVIHGAATGVDTVALNWCRVQWRLGNKVQCWSVPADWERHGKAAGGIRNQAMVNMASALRNAEHRVHVLAFPGPNSRGTYDCIRRAKDADLEVTVTKIGGENDHD